MPTYLYNDKIGYVAYLNHMGPDLPNAYNKNQYDLYNSALIYNTIKFEIVIPAFLYNATFPADTSPRIESSFYEPPFLNSKDSKKDTINPLISYPRDSYAAMPAITAITEHNKVSSKLYSRLIEANVAPSQAQMVLPRSIYIKYETTPSLQSVISFYETNLHRDKEAYKVAKACLNITKQIWPNILKYYKIQ